MSWDHVSWPPGVDGPFARGSRLPGLLVREALPESQGLTTENAARNGWHGSAHAAINAAIHYYGDEQREAARRIGQLYILRAIQAAP